MRIAAARPDHIPAIAALRHALWPDASIAEHEAELRAAPTGTDHALFIALEPDNVVVAFAEVTRRTDYVNGCDGSPVAFLEGIHVAPAHRRQGIARALVGAARDWGRAQGCTEFASDALLDDHASHAFHKAVGFKETERVVCFRLTDEARP